MPESRLLTDEELRIGHECWHEEDHKPGTLPYLCAVALNTAIAEKKKLAVLLKALHDPEIVDVDLIEVYEDHEEGSVLSDLNGDVGRCPFSRDVESTSVRPEACDHPKNERKKVDGVWEGDCGMDGVRSVIPKHCPMRRAVTIIRLRHEGGIVESCHQDDCACFQCVIRAAVLDFEHVLADMEAQGKKPEEENDAEDQS